jgi:hypothetical protein
MLTSSSDRSCPLIHTVSWDGEKGESMIAFLLLEQAENKSRSYTKETIMPAQMHLILSNLTA